MTLILSNDDVEKTLTMRDAVDVLEEAYRELGEGRGVSRRRSDSFTRTKRPDALYSLKSMDGIVPSLGVGAVRINSDIITWPQDGGMGRRVKVPAAPGNRYVGLVLLFSSETGEPLAIFPDGIMQRLRVGAANGLAAKYLARDNARTVGMLGSGWQAGAQLMAIAAVRDIESVRVFSPNRGNREAFAREWSEKLNVRVTPVENPDDAVIGADIAMMATNTIDPVFFAKWVAPGMHITSIKRPEIEAAAIKRADIVVLHSHDGSPMHVLAEGVDVAEASQEGKGWRVAGDIDFKTLPTLPDLIIGRSKRRSSDDQVTCFLNNIGLGYQFAACGSVVYRKAKQQGLGHELPTDWFTEDVHP
jgi:ornithine cyclodeaminase/alanine dehydrogenase-like protein (mu-crystallin family)